MTLQLPPLANPEQYVGLFVYDFKTHVSVGYTAAEIRILRESSKHGDGAAYEIYRVDERGSMELRGALDERLVAREAVCFLRRDPSAARRDFDELRRLADRSPLPCDAELRLSSIASFEPPNLAALLYPAAATIAVSRWLQRCAFAGGDQVIAGIDAHARLTGGGGVIDSATLAGLIDHRDRSRDEVLASVDQPVQR